MLKKVCLGVALLSMSAVAAAQQIEATAGYSSFDLDSVTLGALVAGVGYRIPLNEAVSLTPGARVGFGITDDSVSDVYFEPGVGLVEGSYDVELDSFYGLTLRAQYDTASGLYLFAVPSFSKAKFSEGESTDWEFGIGAGVGFKLSDFASIEGSFERIEFGAVDADVLSVQGRFTF